MIGIGMMVGPVVGSAIYATTNYFQTFVFFGVLEAVALLLCTLYIPANLEGKKVDQDLHDSLLLDLEGI